MLNCFSTTLKNMVSRNYGYARVQRSKSCVGWGGLKRIGIELGVEPRGLRGALGRAGQGQVHRPQEASLKGLKPCPFASKFTRPLLGTPSHPAPPCPSTSPGLQARHAGPTDLCSSPSTPPLDFPRNWVKGWGVGQ